LALEQLERVQADAGRAPAAPRREASPGVPGQAAENRARWPAGSAHSCWKCPNGGARDGRGAPGSQAGATLEEARILARGLLAAIANQPPFPLERRDGEAAEPLSGQTLGDGPDLNQDLAGQPAGSARNWDLLLRRSSRTTLDVTPAPAVGTRGELIPFESIPGAPGAEHETVCRRKAVLGHGKKRASGATT